MYTLSLESIGDDTRDLWLKWRGITGESIPPSRCWVAKITGKHSKFKYAREFIKPEKDYLLANGIGSRGVYFCYHLADGIYEISSPRSWKRTDRYFAKVTGQNLRIIEEDEVGRNI